MGTISERKRKDGTAAYLAQVSLMRKGEVYREAETFDRRPAAAAWIKKREEELKKPGAVFQKPLRDPTLSDAIDKYITASVKAIGRTKKQVLASMKNYDIASLPCSEVDSAAIVGFADELSKVMKPQTVGIYLSYLGAIFAVAKPAWKFPLDQQEMADARAVTKRLGLTSKSSERKRRPTLDELDKLMKHFYGRERGRPDQMKMTLMIAFAIFSTRRQEEITRITWGDLETSHSRILVRDLKHPGDKIGNDVWCDLPEPALKVVTATPEIVPNSESRIFPYNHRSVSSSFTKACKLLDIKDLHFHDLRHEGVSRLFEMGLTIPHVAAVSGHRSWTSLKRYSHIRQTGDKYSEWKWLKTIEER